MGVVAAARGGEVRHAHPKQDDSSGQQSRKHGSLAARKYQSIRGGSSIAKQKRSMVVGAVVVFPNCASRFQRLKQPLEGKAQGGSHPPIRILFDDMS